MMMNMNYCLSIALLLISISKQQAAAVCNVDDHHPENGGYFYKAVGNESEWAAERYYPYGERVVCDPKTDSSCRAPCDTAPGCKQFLDSHTCSILKFCHPEAATTTENTMIYEMPDFEATDACDFSNARELGMVSTDGSCFEYVFEQDHELREYYFSSQQGCATGQKLAVAIRDFALTADQCAVIGLTTPRLRNCDCGLEKKPSTLVEPCRTAFSDACEAIVQPGDCCDEGEDGAGTCISKREDFTNALGKQVELDRRAECDDTIPGLCYNEDGAGTDTNRMGSTNCCEHTCTTCGSELNPSVSWKSCTNYDADSKTAGCGFLSRYDEEAFQCDFSKCTDSSYWSLSGENIKKFADIKETTSGAAGAIISLFALAVSVFSALI